MSGSFFTKLYQLHYQQFFSVVDTVMLNQSNNYYITNRIKSSSSNIPKVLSFENFRRILFAGPSYVQEGGNAPYRKVLPSAIKEISISD